MRISIEMRFAYTPSRNKIFSLILWKYLNFITTFETVTNKVKFRWPLTSGQTKVTGNSFLKRTNDFWLKQNTQIGQDGQIMFTIFTIEGKLKLHCNKLLSQALEWMILLLIAAIEYGFYTFFSSCFDANIAWHNFIEIIRLPDDELKSNILKMMKKKAHKKKQRIQFDMVHLVITFDDLNNAKQNEWRSRNNCTFEPIDVATASMRPTEWRTHSLNHDSI